MLHRFQFGVIYQSSTKRSRVPPKAAEHRRAPNVAIIQRTYQVGGRFEITLSLVSFRLPSPRRTGTSVGFHILALFVYNSPQFALHCLEGAVDSFCQ